MPKLVTHPKTYGIEGTDFTDLDAQFPSQGDTGKALASAMKKRSRTEEGIQSSVQMHIPPEAIEHIIDVIGKSRRILALPQDWDDAGSPGYSTATWEKMKNFLLATAKALWLMDHKRLDPPKILPGPDGSIDIHWKSNQRELLINIPEENSELAPYYGDNRSGQIIKGTLNISVDNRWLILWLMQ